jgi:hypothetical protein
MEELLIVLMKQMYIKKMLSIYKNKVEIVHVHLYNGTDDHTYF